MNPPGQGRVRWLREIAGGLGDTGLFIPIAVALVTLNGLNATAVFAGTGLVYVLTAVAFRVPVPVQPLKAFAAAAIALGLSAETLAAGALLMAAIMAVLALSGAAAWLAARFPLVLVRGIQAAVALLLVKAAWTLAEQGNWEGLAPISLPLSVVVALVGVAVLWIARRRGLPGSLVVLAGGAVIGLIAAGAPEVGELGPQPISLALPDGDAFAEALGALVLAQVPLTFGNSVVATCDAERTYFGARAARVRPARLATSIAGANLLAGLTVGMPTCHGAGGVTAHYSMGARTARSTIAIGVALIVAGLAFGDSLPALLQVLAPGALAGMLLYVAIEHGLLAARLERLDDRLIAAGVGLVTILAGNLAIGFGFGVVALLLRGALRWAGGAAGRRPRSSAVG